MRDHEVWRYELISEIRTIADEAELRRLWTGVNPRSISSFAEEVAHIFSDYDIDGFIEAGADEGKLSSAQFAALQRFRDRFAAYLNEIAPMPLASISHESILGDRRWGQVIKTAREFIALVE